MSNSDDNNDTPPSTALARPERTGNLLEYSLQRLQGQAGRELIEAAQREALRLQVEAHERELRRSMSQAEMDAFVVQAIRTIRQVDAKRTKVTMNGEFETGTGRTSINVQSRTCFVATAVYESPNAPGGCPALC